MLISSRADRLSSGPKMRKVLEPVIITEAQKVKKCEEISMVAISPSYCSTLRCYVAFEYPATVLISM